ncbi:MAG: hypothetical protein B5M53_03790 [Candidatus Cloacimonas sp. 4484_209]|nr:MAG: hypothetical protein B5M53_03790 [Candidatus Cloacimonas sp. 4484_209]
MEGEILVKMRWKSIPRGLSVCILPKNKYELWDKFVDRSPQGTLFHKSFWFEASQKPFNIYILKKTDKIIAGIPIVYTRRYGFKLVRHPPLTPYGGLIFCQNTSPKYVTRISLEKRVGTCLGTILISEFDSVDIIFPPVPVNLLPLMLIGFSSSLRYTYILKLNDLKETWENMSQTTRNDIRKAERDGLYISTNEHFEKLTTLVRKTYIRQNVDISLLNYAVRYHSILKKVNQCRLFVTIDKRGQAIAAAYIVWDNKRSYYLLGGYDPDNRHHGALALAIWEAIKFTKNELSLREFDFEGSHLPAIERFFRGFGGALTPYCRVSWNSPLLGIGLDLREGMQKLLRFLRDKKL